jgi:hypothetical protein
MTSSPVFYDDGQDRFVWCVDERGAIRVWPLAALDRPDRDVALACWGWRYATDIEVAEHQAAQRRRTLA